MSLYHLHARLFEGSLCDPVRNELQTRETDDLAELTTLAEDLAARGFTVWIYDHGHRSPFLLACDFRCIRKLLPAGRVEHATSRSRSRARR